MSKRLLSCIREVDTAARYGGDEFLVDLVDVNDKNGPDIVAQKLISELSKSFHLPHGKASIRASIGMS